MARKKSLGTVLFAAMSYPPNLGFTSFWARELLAWVAQRSEVYAVLAEDCYVDMALKDGAKEVLASPLRQLSLYRDYSIVCAILLAEATRVGAKTIILGDPQLEMLKTDLEGQGFEILLGRPSLRSETALLPTIVQLVNAVAPPREASIQELRELYDIPTGTTVLLPIDLLATNDVVHMLEAAGSWPADIQFILCSGPSSARERIETELEFRKVRHIWSPSIPREHWVNVARSVTVLAVPLSAGDVDPYVLFAINLAARFGAPTCIVSATRPMGIDPAIVNIGYSDAVKLGQGNSPPDYTRVESRTGSVGLPSVVRRSQITYIDSDDHRFDLRNCPSDTLIMWRTRGVTFHEDAWNELAEFILQYRVACATCYWIWEEGPLSRLMCPPSASVQHLLDVRSPMRLALMCIDPSVIGQRSRQPLVVGTVPRVLARINGGHRLIADAAETSIREAILGG